MTADRDHRLSGPPLEVVLTDEPWPLPFGWRTRDGIYVGSCFTADERDAAIRAAGHRVIGPKAEPVPEPAPAPPGPVLPDVTADAIRAAGMVPIKFGEARSPRGPVRIETLACPLFPDLQKVIRIGPERDARRVSFVVAGQEVPARPDAIVQALAGLGAARKPPMEQRR